MKRTPLRGFDLDAVTGRQVPLNVATTPGGYEMGGAAVRLACRVTAPPLPWQEWVVRELLATRPDGGWCHPDGLLLVPRQNGKSWILCVLVIYKLFVLRENIFFTAQQWKTAEDLWKRTWAIVDANSSLKRRVVKRTCSQGRGTIVLGPVEGEASGPIVTFTTRSADAGRGLSTIDTLIYDEAYNLTESETSALAFTQLAADHPQTIYTSSAVNAEVHFYGEVLASLRQRGMSDDTEGFFFAEWAAPGDMDREAEETWQFANPSYGVIQTREKIEKLMRGMSTLSGQRAFDVEALGRGDWPIVDTGELDPIVPLDDWAEWVEPSPIVVGDSAVAVDVTPDAEHAGVCAAVRTRDGVHLSAGPLRDFARDAALKSLERAVTLNDPVAVVLDPAGPASSLTAGLRDLGVEPELIGPRRLTAATELFLQLCAEGQITHDGDPRWVEALKAAEFRPVRGETGRALTRTHGDISLLVAATFAVWGLIECEVPAAPPDSARAKKFVGTAAVELGPVPIGKF